MKFEKIANSKTKKSSNRQLAVRLGCLMFSAGMLSGCAWTPSLDRLNQRLGGMSKQELLYCMGTPSRVARQDDMEMVTYSYNYSPDSTLLKCDTHLSFIDGRLSRVRVTAGTPGTLDLVSSTCRAAVEKCGR